MSEGKRPGGLTAMAVINFVFAGLGAIGVLGIIALITILTISKNSAAMTKASEEMNKALGNAHIGVSFLIFLAAFSIVSSVLLLISGIGYLKQKKFIGLMLGNITAILSIASHVLTAVVLPAGAAGGGFSLGFLFNMIYPVLTLILLNTTFKEDFIN
jgi:hypothetical protein